MRRIFNERHVLKEENASDLEVLRELNKRLVFNEKFSKELKQLEAKEKGLENFLTLINKYAKDHWCYMTDLSLDYYNTFKCDFLLMTSAGIYTFEINYYDGVFEVENGQASINDSSLDYNPIENAQKVASQLKSIAQMNSIHFNVRGAVVFPGLDNKVILHDEVKDIDIVTLNHLEKHLKQIVQEEKKYRGPSMNTPIHLRWVAKIDRHFPNWSLQFPEETEESMRKGILCRHCGRFDINIDEPYISCRCGMHELLEEAIVRTICEYGVLNNDKQLYPPELLDFFDHQISMNHLTKYLNKHFIPVA